jgi:hypothetical protein
VDPKLAEKLEFFEIFAVIVVCNKISCAQKNRGVIAIFSVISSI